MSHIRLEDLDHPAAPSKKDYEARLEALQLQMLRIQAAYRAQKRRAVIAMEGSDAAGKGGAIRRLTALLDPRGVNVVAVGAPTPAEQGRHYLYRFWRDLPVPGTITIFDRSWYGRVLVERVEGFCEEAAWKRAYSEINAFEEMLVADGAPVVKLLLHITQGEQLQRFADRLADPVKRWKFTRDDLRNRKQWGAYAEAFEDMLAKTHTKKAPWTVVSANAKRHARLAVLEAVTQRLAEGVDLSAPLAPHDLVREATTALGLPLPPDIAPSPTAAATQPPEASPKAKKNKPKSKGSKGKRKKSKGGAKPQKTDKKAKKK
ncbi:MAG: polyphosphate kinase [Myxococcota bacterium]